MSRNQILKLLKDCREYVEQAMEAGISEGMLDEDECDGDRDLMKRLDRAIKRVSTERLA